MLDLYFNLLTQEWRLAYRGKAYMWKGDGSNFDAARRVALDIISEQTLCQTEPGLAAPKFVLITDAPYLVAPVDD